MKRYWYVLIVLAVLFIGMFVFRTSSSTPFSCTERRCVSFVNLEFLSADPSFAYVAVGEQVVDMCSEGSARFLSNATIRVIDDSGLIRSGEEFVIEVFTRSSCDDELVMLRTLSSSQGELFTHYPNSPQCPGACDSLNVQI